jgi:predicted alpha/beta superfamily hydrolase
LPKIFHMKVINGFIVFLFFNLTLFGQLTIKVTSIPLSTPVNDKIYIAGNFNNWNPSDASSILIKQNDGSYQIVIRPPVGTVEYKFTRGSWATVEGNASGQVRPNRQLTYNGTTQTVDIQILSWEDLSNTSSTAQPNVRIISTNFTIPQLNRTRRIWVYLPPQYLSDTTKRFPVMYMHDGQNLFDKATSFSGEWEVDETLNMLTSQGDKGCIVVGIDNGGASRLNELSPWVNPQYGGGEGDKYMKFVVQTLKPYVDANFRTKSDRLNTGIAGSSMGGLISMYGAMEHQEIFSKVGIFSPAFWFALDSSLNHIVSRGKRFPMRFYFVAGKNESQGMMPDIYKMEKMLQGIGYFTDVYKIVPKDDGQHSEWFWAREFGGAYKYLFAENASNTEGVDLSNKITILPNPIRDYFRIETKENLHNVTIFITDTLGRTVYNRIYQNKDININALKKGTYIVSGKRGNQIVFSKKIVKS